MKQRRKRISLNNMASSSSSVNHDIIIIDSDSGILQQRKKRISLHMASSSSSVNRDIIIIDSDSGIVQQRKKRISLKNMAGSSISVNHDPIIIDSDDDDDEIFFITGEPSSSSKSQKDPTLLKRKRATELPERFCGICMDTKAPSEMFSNAKVCSHQFCSDCIREHISVKIKENIANVKCPDPKCKGVIGPELCRSIVPKEVLDRWEDALCESLILGTQKFYCPFKDCSAMLVDDGGEAITMSECPHCNRLFCAQCKVTWHSVMDCSEFQRLKKDEINPEDINLMQLAKNKKWKRCPSCNIFVEKRDGCNRINCRCGNHFCYECGKKHVGSYACGRKEEPEVRKFKEMVEETFRLSGASNIGDFFPLAKWIGVNSMEKTMVKLNGKKDSSIQEMIELHRRLRSHDSSTIIDVLLSLQKTEPEYYTDEIIKGHDISTDTSAGTLEWALSLLLNHPDSLKTLVGEIDNTVGSSRLITDSDLPNLPYLHGVINETLRMCPAATLIPPHESSELCTVGGFLVPPGTMLLVKLWAIQNDPKLWEETERFKPERFVDCEGQRENT